MLYKKLLKGISIFLAVSLMLMSGFTAFADETITTPGVDQTTPSDPAADTTDNTDNVIEPVSVSVSANYFKKADNDYEIIFSSLDVLDEYKSFNFTVTVTDGRITAQSFSPALKTGSYSFSVVGDNSVNFSNGSSDTYIGGKLTLCSVNTDVLPAADKISFTGFTATDKDGNTVTFEPTLTLEEGPVVPELSDEEADVYDKILALPEVSDLSFYDNGELIDINIIATQVEETVDAYNDLSQTEKNNVLEVLTYNMESAEGLTTLPPVIESMKDVYDVFVLSLILAPIEDSDIVNYQFITDVYDSIKDEISADGLPEGSTLSTEYTAAKTLVEGKETLITEAQAAMDYNSKIECIGKQLELSKGLTTDKYYNDYLDFILASAEALYDDIEENCDEDHPEYRYKRYMLEELNEVITDIQAVINKVTSLPEFEVKSMRLQSNYDITLTRDKDVAVAATVKIKVYEEEDPDNLIETKTATFKNGVKELKVTMFASKSKYPSADKKIIIQVEYTVDGITYNLGSKTVTCLKQLAQAPSSGLSSAITGNTSSKNDDDDDDNTSSGTIFPSIDDDDDDKSGNKSDKDEDLLFNDIENYDWAEEAIEGLYYAGIINGMEEGVFNPAGNVTREQFCKMVVQLFEVLDYSEFENKFNDVDPNAWYAPYINSAIKSGYVQGQSDDFFGIGESIMRQDMATILYRALGSQGEGIDITFTDKDSIASYAWDAISELCGLGILNGYEDGSFNPRGTATRAEAAKVIWGIYELLND